jgi:outer membrane scaffolding protein for murein synthesis (MipA/OmpV family)
MRTSACRSLLLAAGLALAGTAASAQSFDAVRLFTPPKGDGSGSAGLVAVAGRAYTGSDESRFQLLPVLNYRWKNGWFAGTGNGIGYLFEAPEHLQYGLRLTADLGRKSKRSAVLEGMDDVSPTLEAGGFFNLFLSRQLFFTSSLRFGSGDGQRGIVLDLGAQYALMLNPQWRLSFGAGASLANGSHMQTYFGVPGDKTTATRPAYQAGAGLRELRATVSVTHFITPEWDAVASVSGTSLQGDARRSVLVRDTRPVTGILAVTRDF